MKMSSLAKQPFWAIAFLRRYCKSCLFRRELDHPVFASLNFAAVIFYRARLSALSPTPNLEDQVSAFMSPSDKVAQLYPQASGSFFVAFYDLQGYGGGILTRQYTGIY
jgi:hypothetical protein